MISNKTMNKFYLKGRKINLKKELWKFIKVIMKIHKTHKNKK
jgi:hypothetical protein